MTAVARSESAELAALDDHLAAVVDGLAAPPADRDPVLWAAHEAAMVARTLLALRTEDTEADWGAVLASARAAMATLSYARREVGG